MVPARLVVIGADVDANVAIGFVKPGIGVALFHLDAPPLDTLGHDLIGGDGVAWTVVSAQIARFTILLHAELNRCVGNQW